MPKKPKSKLVRAVAGALALGSFAVASRAGAQTLTLVTANINHGDAAARPNMPKTYINRADCLNDDVITFPVTYGGSGYLGLTLDVWAGTGCDTVANRTNNSVQCWLVHRDVVSMVSENVNVHVRDILFGATALGTTGGADAGADGGTTATGFPPAGTLIENTPATVCTPDLSVQTAQPITIFFYLISNTAASTSVSSANWPATYKLLGPPPPTGLTAGVGENELIIDFTANTTDPSATGFTAFCDPPPSGGGTLDAGLTPCMPSSVLVANADPPNGYQCGSSAQGATEVIATGLTNGQAYNVAVSAIDNYFNTGKLSASTCQNPQPVTSFYQAYRDAGGRGGGGFCSISRREASTTALALLGLVGVGAFWRRRAR